MSSGRSSDSASSELEAKILAEFVTADSERSLYDLFERVRVAAQVDLAELGLALGELLRAGRIEARYKVRARTGERHGLRYASSLDQLPLTADDDWTGDHFVVTPNDVEVVFRSARQ